MQENGVSGVVASSPEFEKKTFFREKINPRLCARYTGRGVVERYLGCFTKHDRIKSQLKLVCAAELHV